MVFEYKPSEGKLLHSSPLEALVRHIIKTPSYSEATGNQRAYVTGSGASAKAAAKVYCEKLFNTDLISSGLSDQDDVQNYRHPLQRSRVEHSTSLILPETCLPAPPLPPAPSVNPQGVESLTELLNCQPTSVRDRPRPKPKIIKRRPNAPTEPTQGDPPLIAVPKTTPPKVNPPKMVPPKVASGKKVPPVVPTTTSSTPKAVPPKVTPSKAVHPQKDHPKAITPKTTPTTPQTAPESLHPKAVSADSNLVPAQASSFTSQVLALNKQPRMAHLTWEIASVQLELANDIVREATRTSAQEGPAWDLGGNLQ
ncbi:hypothetical protein PAXINDRAFT_157631 [Paxillus involutus ATCC 200175]|uniref:Uncharacterized protein n=1 Tax=Paxillus involutus ATCC 200175 TaxID=664439 RepID=A0A0C9T461_PAXIN|nr:hypothetical protein PAXINDRAFT_157631 [Paxillus involutus ATCC 200175]